MRIRYRLNIVVAIARKRLLLALCLGAAIALPILQSQLRAQSAKSTRDGIYTLEQAKRYRAATV